MTFESAFLKKPKLRGKARQYGKPIAPWPDSLAVGIPKYCSLCGSRRGLMRSGPRDNMRVPPYLQLQFCGVADFMRRFSAEFGATPPIAHA
ncbi:MAG: hypothetical protein DMG97_19050 [Acidobacteria bacterium]|nr:MAG: hypothetical protein DMG97_19050 [Acidobacteriota bacterium]